jgi:putative Mn2+ efflux pump MntP
MSYNMQMGILEILIIGLGLSADAFAVTIANAACVAAAGSGSEQTRQKQTIKPSRSLLLAAPVIFGIFQGIMPLIGYFAITAIISWLQNSPLADLLTNVQFISSEFILGLISAIILWIVGAKMLLAAINAIRHPNEATVEGVANIGLPTLAAQGLATSLDALLIGVTLATSSVNIGLAAGLIAITTFVCCLGALALGRRFGILLGERAQVAGGIVLILIGVKALFA